MRAGWRGVVGTVCVSLGVLLAASSGFLAYWEYGAHGERDIAARGGFLLYMLLPWLVGVGWAAVAALTSRPLRRTGSEWWAVLGLTLSSTLAAAVLAFQPPLFLTLRALAPLPAPLRPGADFALAAALVAAGLALVRRAGSRRPPNEALQPTSAFEAV
jgi:hypothetical protein